MPDYPPITGLKTAVERKLIPQGATDASPVALRALAVLGKQYPADTAGVRVQDMPMDDPRAFSSTLATTPIKGANTIVGLPERDPETITVNPAVSAIFPQSSVQDTLSHELEHIRQNRYGRNPLMRLADNIELPYDQQPDENAAFAAQRQYEPTHPPPSIESLRNMDSFIPMMQQLFTKGRK